MSRCFPLAPLALLAPFGIAAACGAVPDDPGARLFAVGGVIRGSVVYRGPRPCSRNGHIVGNAVVLVFDQRSPPPPRGLSTAPVNFTDVVGDVLFGNEPRYSGPELYCPQAHGFAETISASAPYEVAPLAAGSYEIHAFFDFTGNFLPSFKIRNSPERGDVSGGYVAPVDPSAALAAGASFMPELLPVSIGVPRLAQGESAPGSPATTDLVLPPSGFVADNVTVTIDSPIQTARPYFFAQGLTTELAPGTGTLSSLVTQSSDAPAGDTTSVGGTREVNPNYVPVMTIPQDIEVLAAPRTMDAPGVSHLESSFPHLRLQWGVPSGELAAGTTAPFNMQLAPFEKTGGVGFSVWGDTARDPASGRYVPRLIPEGGAPKLWPLVVLTKLVDDPTHQVDPASLSAQGGRATPIVILQAITLLGSPDPSASDSLLSTVLSAGSLLDGAGRPIVAQQDHLTVLLRPSVICFAAPADSSAAFQPGTLVTAHRLGTTADVDCSSGSCVPAGTPDQPLFPPNLVDAPQLSSLVSGPVLEGCLPLGRFAISVVYPGGQSWTVPNEAGACSGSEGVSDYVNLTCSLKPRPLLYSQGNRAVVEIVAPHDPAYCGAHPVPAPCGGS